jgi:SRSO17 transposase
LLISALQGLPEALNAHLAFFASFFVSSTRDTTATFEGYMRGLFQSERANMLRMSEVNEVDHQSMQHMLTEGCADWQGFGRQIAQEANDLLGGTDAVLIFDESGFAKKGESSAGVARQWNGRLGKVDNGQVGVFATLCRGDMATLIDTRLYLPEAWCDDDERCKKAAIPEDKRQFQSKTQLGRWRC